MTFKENDILCIELSKYIKINIVDCLISLYNMYFVGITKLVML